MNTNVDTSIENENHNNKKNIKHLVISGGGTSGFITYGALKKSHELGVWNINNIQSIYGTSAGAIISIILALKYEWKILDDYLIKRPWHHIFKYDLYSVFGAFEKRGIFNIKIIEEIFSSLFSGMDISIDITMRDFYELNHIDIHIFATDINAFEPVDISHTTHPEWRVMDAVYASSCLPMFFAPLVKDGKYYIDGGIFLNYPLEPCIKCANINSDEILGIRKQFLKSNNDYISETSNLMDYILVLLQKVMKTLIKSSVDNLSNEIIINANMTSAFDLLRMSSSEEMRTEWITEGVELAQKLFL